MRKDGSGRTSGVYGSLCVPGVGEALGSWWRVGGGGGGWGEGGAIRRYGALEAISRYYIRQNGMSGESPGLQADVLRGRGADGLPRIGSNERGSWMVRERGARAGGTGLRRRWCCGRGLLARRPRAPSTDAPSRNSGALKPNGYPSARPTESPRGGYLGDGWWGASAIFARRRPALRLRQKR